MSDGYFHPHDTSRSLPLALLRAREAVMAKFRPVLQAHGITEQQWRVIRVLHESGGIDVTTLARRSSILAPSLSRILKLLETQGYVEKAKDNDDGRVYKLALTDGGRALLERVRPDSERIYADLERSLGRARIDKLLDLLNESVRRIESG
jgi:homoprotocatechuate degradation regulator HpaR